MEQNIPFEKESIRRLQSARPMQSIDGIHDLLTTLAAPSVFYEQLQREIAIAERYRNPFHLIKLKLLPDELIEESSYELALLNLSRTLIKVTRADDFLSRTGSIEFIVIFHGETIEIDYFFVRLMDNWQEGKFNLMYSTTRFNLYEGQLSLLRRMDESPLHRLPT